MRLADLPADTQLVELPLYATLVFRGDNMFEAARHVAHHLSAIHRGDVTIIALTGNQTLGSLTEEEMRACGWARIEVG